jgi:hypothetical protein
MTGLRTRHKFANNTSAGASVSKRPERHANPLKSFSDWSQAEPQEEG